MKWKSVSPDVKRRESPKFKQQSTDLKFAYPSSKLKYKRKRDIELLTYTTGYYSYSNYSNEPIELVARRFQEIERHEREMAKIREFEQNYKGSYKAVYSKDYNYNHDHNYNYRNYDDDYVRSTYDNTQSYRSNYGNPIRNNIWENENNYNNYNNYTVRNNNNNIYYQQNVKRNWIEDDEEEDELYFYGGGRKKKQKEHEEEEEPKEEIYAKDFEYDPADFETSDDPSSSWSTDSESEHEKMVKKKINSKSKMPISKAEDSTRTFSGVKPKAYVPKVIDLDAPTMIKLPPNPIPNTWTHIVHNPLKAIQKQLPSTTEILTKSIANRRWLEGLKLLNPVQGILMRPPFDEETFSIKQWAKFMQKLLPTVMPDGYLFIWIEREELADVIRAAEEYLSFKYVENLCWIRRDVGNRLMREAPNETGTPALFYKSKMTLLILRRDPNNRCKLRHQRNPDCIFDFVGPGRMPDGRVYDVIETLLDGGKMPGPHLMHLWAGSSATDRLVYQARSQWIRVLEVDDELEGNESDEAIVSVQDEADKVNVETEDIESSLATEDANKVPEAESNALIPDESTQLIVPETQEDVSTVFSDTVLAETQETQSKDESLKAVEDTQLSLEPLQEPVDSLNSIDSVEAIVNETLADLNTNGTNDIKDECKIPGSSTFDEDFCNFIVCEPLSNC